MKKIIVINLGWEQEPLLDKLSEYDVEIYGIHYDSDYYKKPKYKDILICDLRDLKKILDFAQKIKPDAVISDECDYSHFAQAVIAEKFKLKGPSIENAQISSNKYLQRKLAKEKGIKIPNFKLCSHIDDAKKFIEKYSFPSIIKPIDNRGSFGVHKVNSLEELEKLFFNSLVNSQSRLVVIEEFINGIHLTVDGYCFRDTGTKSLTIAMKELPLEDVEVAMNIYYPANLDKKQFEKILNMNSNINNKLGYTFGMIHSEYMLKDSELYLIESANRGGGVYTSEIIVPNITDIDLLKLYIEDVLDINQSKYKNPKQNSVSLNFFCFKSGKIKDIKNISQIENNNSILSFRLAFKKGDIIREINSDANRHGFIIIKGNNPKKTFKRINKILEVKYESNSK